MFIYDLDETTKQLQIKFPGGPSGNYKISIVHAVEGNFNSEALTIVTETVVTGISANQGSRNGGQLLSIYGRGFSDDPLDNPVTVDGNHCYVVTTSATLITCRIAEVMTEPSIN